MSCNQKASKMIVLSKLRSTKTVALPQRARWRTLPIVRHARFFCANLPRLRLGLFHLSKTITRKSAQQVF
jgi:hypothetical protein